MTETRLQLHGLCCGNDATAVEKAVAAVGGVEAARVNPATYRLTVSHDGALAPIVGAVEALGYTATPIAAKLPPPPPAARWPIAAAAALVAAAWLLSTRLGDAHPAVAATYAAAALAGGWRTFKRGFGSLRVRRFDMNALMTIGTAGAFAIGAWGEGGTIALLYAVSNWLEDATTARTRDALRGLMDLAPPVALVRRGEVETEVPAEAIAVGDTVILRSGERIAVDGLVLAGRSAVDQAALTGESMPVEKGPGDEVLAGSLNGSGALEIRASAAAADSSLARIVHLVEEAQGARAPIQDFVDRFAAVYTPAVLVVALAIALVPPLALGWPWFEWAYRALALIVFACPCALVVSTPVALATGIGNAARHGVLIKGGVHLEQVATTRVWAFDKTGTLTMGRPEVQHVEALGGLDVREVLRLASAVERRSEHPLATAIMRHAAANGIFGARGADFEALVGRGARATVDGRAVYVASPRYAEENGGLDASTAVVEAQQALGRTVVVVGDETGPLGLVAIADPVRPAAAALARDLKALGIVHVAMLTGDNARTARAVAAGLGLDEVRADLLPADKIAAVKDLEARFGPVAMVGDGINDAPALAAARTSVAMGGGGTDVAIETADVALMGDDVARLPFLVRLSRATRRVIWQNIAFSLAVKALALVAVLPGWLTLWMAVLGDMGATILVTLNSLRLLGLRPGR